MDKKVKKKQNLTVHHRVRVDQIHPVDQRRDLHRRERVEEVGVVSLGAAVADGKRRAAAGWLLLLLSAVVAVLFRKKTRARFRRNDDPLGALPGAGADERRDLLPVEPRAALFEFPEQRERREAPVDPGEAEVVRRDCLEGGSVLKVFFFFFLRERERGG